MFYGDERLGKTSQTKRSSNRFVVYLRVSTKRQGESGLGLEAQRAAAQAYVKEHGGEIIGEYQEVETGKDCERPEIMKALLHADRSFASRRDCQARSGSLEAFGFVAHC